MLESTDTKSIIQGLDLVSDVLAAGSKVGDI